VQSAGFAFCTRERGHGAAMLQEAIDHLGDGALLGCGQLFDLLGYAARREKRTGFANGDPANFSDPFGLCPENLSLTQTYLCNLFEAGMVGLGGMGGFVGGGGSGLLRAGVHRCFSTTCRCWICGGGKRWSRGGKSHHERSVREEG
jgi:hypothetical protein